MDALIRARGAVKRKLTTFKNYLAKISAGSPDITQPLEQITQLELKERLDGARKLYDAYDEIQGKIDEIDGESGARAEDEEYREVFEEEYYVALAQAKMLLARGNVIQSIPSISNAEMQNTATQPQLQGQNNVFDPQLFARQTNQSIVFKQPGIRLPTIELPKFKGDVSEWLGFRDTFNSLIHKNETIDPIQKFHYLKAALQGNAAQIIKSLEFSAINYAVAWETICNRFDNKRLLTHNHIQAIFNINHMQEESSSDIRNIIDTLNKHLRALNALGQSTEHWDALIIYVISAKIDNITAREWEKQCAEYELPTLEQFKEFLTLRASILETLELNNKAPKSKRTERTKTKSLLIQNQSCAVCKEAHYINQCPKFLEFTPQKRLECLKNTKLCLNCMKPGHFIKQCKAGSCKQCHAKHNTLIHFDKLSDKSSQDIDTQDSTKTNAAVLCSHNLAKNTHVLLATALVLVKDRQGKYHKARALLDAGSQSSLITNDFCTKLQVERKEVQINLEAVNNASCQIRHKCDIRIAAHHNQHEFSLTCLVVQDITGCLPQFKFEKRKLQIPQNIRLADPSFNIPAAVDILLGADCFWSLLCIGQIKVGQESLIMQKTKLGWIAAGPIVSPLTTSTIRCNVSRCIDISDQLRRFWELEECTTQLSRKENECESYFVQTYKRDANGRFIVRIPFKKDPSTLGESYSKALQRLVHLEKRLDKRPTIKEQYALFLREYRDLGHMKEITVNSNEVAYYLPHHCIIRSESLTTKIRVVFDASAASDNGISLNDIQLVGPTLQDDLLSILIRFRMHIYVVAADIEKMFRQILVAPDQCSLQRILWRSNTKDTVKVFELNTLTYGTASAPYLSTRCLIELANQNEQQFPEIANIIRRDFYVDDLLTGTDSVERARDIVYKVSNILASAGFKLRKWISNESAILRDIPEEDQNPNYVNFIEGGQTKTLGLTWQAHHDTLAYLRRDLPQVKVTKRTILSEMTQIFDPLGLLSPYIIIAKILLQKLWLHKLTWDESLPHDLHSMWISFRTQLRNLDQIRIPRNIVCKNYKEIQLHGFADASKDAYGACIYIRSLDSQGNISVHLLCSKTRVAPLKTQTIPRLELCAALILARLVRKVTESLNVSFDQIVYWSDSTIVLGWLRMQSNKLQVFVSNRVSEAQQLSEQGEWRHVPTQDNPADILSRGLSLEYLAQSGTWWHGPHFLLRSENEWPPRPEEFEASTVEVKKTVCTLTQIDLSIFNITANLGKLIRIMAYCKRFISNCKHQSEDKSPTLTVVELTNALHTLAKLAQQQSFATEIQLLRNGNTVTKGKLVPLNPFLDEEGLIRVGGRLKNTEFTVDKKHPIVLSADHKFTQMLFASEHLRLMHAGPQLLLFSVREKFWPIGGRNLARKTVRNCIKCFRHNPRQADIPQGDLPNFRVTSTAPFHATGVDYAGPFFIKDRKGRGCKTSKAYVCLFVCFATKAIHLELVSDLTSEAFIAALRRFSSRRGKPAHIYSDNASNFVGANKELESLARFLADESKHIVDALADIGVTWHFIPAYSPHFGGLWEAGVKSTKYHLKRIAGGSVLTFEEFYTFLTQIEALLNSRPLIPMSSDPNDLTPITPAHFLIGRTLLSVADPTITHIPDSRLSRWQLLQKLQQHFWQRWSKEYLSELQVRKGKGEFTKHFTEGMLIIIKEDNLPAFRWKLGRITAVHPGKDGVARVATVKTATGTIRIATAKLCPLPNEECIHNK